MCLAIPGKVEKKYDKNGLEMGLIDFSGTKTEVCLAYVPEAEIDSYVIVHAGFAISVLDEDEAEKVFDEFRRMEARLREEGEL
jgi:hydrogenase expression/formation protein HypC